MATSSEIWTDILKGDVQKDDPLWEEYLGKAAVFDERMLDELNKIVDVLLVYVALFISTLTSFIIQANTLLQPNPTVTTNDLLNAIYIQMVAQSNITGNASIPLADFQPTNPNLVDAGAITQNALLYTSLSLCITVSMISLAAKLWLVSYNHQAFSVGSPYERAMKRQEAYNGVLVWNLRGVINILPVILLIALLLFDIYVYMSISAIQNIIGAVVAALFNAGLLFFGLTCLSGAFFPGCPFRSAFSSAIQFIFEIPWKLFKWILHERCLQLPVPRHRRRLPVDRRKQLIQFANNAFLGCLPMTVITIIIPLKSDVNITGIWSSLFFLIAAGLPLAFIAQQKADHYPQKYKISQLALWGFLPNLVVMSSVLWFQYSVYSTDIEDAIILTTISVFGTFIMCLANLIFGKMSKSMANTGEIDAIAWLLKTAPPPNSAEFFKKAGQMTVSKSRGSHYRPRLLESLMPFLTLLIISHHLPKHPSSESDTPSPSSNDENPDSKRELENIEIYTACLARLSDFRDSEGSFICLWEDTMQHPELEPPLVDKLVQFANLDPRHRFHDRLRSAAIKVLRNYRLGMEGQSVGVPAALERYGVATGLLNVALSMLTVRVGWLNDREEQGDRNLQEPVELELGTHVEPPHSSGDIEEA